MKIKFNLIKKSVFSFLFVLLAVQPLWADISVVSLSKKFELPSAEWKKGTPNLQDKEFFNIESKKLGKALTIAGRTDNIPMDSKAYLTEIRKYLMDDKKNYKDAQINLVEPRTAFGKNWDVVAIQAPDGLHQELWSRKIDETQVILFLYTGIGEPFKINHADFDKILEQGAKL